MPSTWRDRRTACLASFVMAAIVGSMGTMNISLPDALRAFVDEQVTRGRYGSTSEYVRELIRRDRDRAQLRDLLLEGATSAPDTEADEGFYGALRERASTPTRG